MIVCPNSHIVGGKTLTKPIRLSTTLRMHNSGPGSMRIRRIGIGHGGMYDWNLFRIGDHSREIVIHANKTKKVELSYVTLHTHTNSLSLSLSLSFAC